jgi:DNA-binding GntR family transcriptional regulator
MSFDKLGRKKLLRDRIYEMLKEAIFSGELKPGERIVETRLAEDMGISRTPIREAIRHLESEGYIESMDNGGVKVSEITEDDIREWNEIKYILDELAVMKAIDNMDDELIEDLKKDLKKVEEALEKDNIDDEEIIDLNTDFHEKMFEISGNKLIHNIRESYQKYNYMMRKYLSTIEGRHEKALKEHKDILQAIVEKDKEKARKLSKVHSESSKNALLNKLNKK